MIDARSVLAFTSDADEADLAELVLTRVEGREQISALYEYVLHLRTHVDGGLASEAIDAWLSRPCRFAFGDALVCGLVNEVRLLPTNDPAVVLYEAVLVPRLWAATQTTRSRVYQSSTVVDIVRSILDVHGVPHTFATRETYPTLEYVVQYQESDFAFVSRLLEHWGIFYFFEQRPDGEHLVLGDSNKAFLTHEAYAELPFNPVPSDASRIGWINALRRVTRPQTASVTIADYNWRTPFLDTDGHMTTRQLQLRVSTPADAATGRGEEWRYGEHVKDPTEATLIATVRAEERLARRVTYDASLMAPGLAAGHRFTVTGMPLTELDQEYVVTELRTSYETGEGAATVASQSITAIAGTVAYRPALRTPKPRIHGFMHAVVDGEVHSTAAPIDDLGRYKVLMPYDTAARPGGGASRWIRMAQPSSGPHYGMHFPLHIGTEVAVIHLDGDPDRPVILGSVPNVDTVSPVVDQNATMSRIRTRSNILFELEDDA